MSVFTSTDFASVIVSGTDWRDTSKATLEQLSDIRTENDGFNIGFLYISDSLSEDMSSILNLFKSVTGIDQWIGSVGMGVCGNNEVYVDEPAISVMIGRFDPAHFTLFDLQESDKDRADEVIRIQKWVHENMPMLVLTHADPMTEGSPSEDLEALSKLTNGFVIGGLSSSRKTHAQIAGGITDRGMSGIILSHQIPVATSLSQGCAPLGEPHSITRGHDHVIYELDGKKALDVLNQDLRAMVIKTIDQDPDEITLDEAALDSPENIPEEYRALFEGQVHIAFPNQQSDKTDLLVRNIIGADQDEGSVAVSQMICSGENVIFVRRNADILRTDLTETLKALKERIIRQEGEFKPKGAVYISCLARAVADFDENKTDKDFTVPDHEMEIIRDVLGDLPLTGFYAAGEISNAKLYGYTGILTLFL